MYTDDVMTGICWHASRPPAPDTGDCYFDSATNQGYIWQGMAWIAFSGDPLPAPPFMPPTEEQMKKHPSLKKAWEEFMVIKKLLGV
jgi:hypothetical protein